MLGDFERHKDHHKICTQKKITRRWSVPEFLGALLRRGIEVRHVRRRRRVSFRRSAFASFFVAALPLLVVALVCDNVRGALAETASISPLPIKGHAGASAEIISENSGSQNLSLLSAR